MGSLVRRHEPQPCQQVVEDPLADRHTCVAVQVQRPGHEIGLDAQGAERRGSGTRPIEFAPVPMPS